MADKLIVTIGRQTGSGGRKIGQMLAERLGVKCYDKELLDRAAKESGLCRELFENNDEKPTNSFLYSLVMDTYSLGYSSSPYVDMPINQKIFLAQFDTIRNLAASESCVIVGRCADYALAGMPGVVSVFVSADDEDKIKRLMETHNVTADKAREIMLKTDKRRSSYYNYYSNKRWGDSKSYDLCINSSKCTLEGAVDVILAYAEIAKKYRGKTGDCFVKFLQDKLVLAAAESDGGSCCVYHAGIPAELFDRLVEITKKSGVFQEVITARAGSIISSHCGPETIGFTYQKKA